MTWTGHAGRAQSDDAARRRGCHSLQSGDRMLRTRFVDVPEHGVEDDDHGNHEGLVGAP
jgi:hypothetical protein